MAAKDPQRINPVNNIDNALLIFLLIVLFYLKNLDLFLNIKYLLS